MEYVPFEKPIADLENRINNLRRMASNQAVNLDEEILQLEGKASELRQKMFANLKPYEAVQLSRHPRRPNVKELVGRMCSKFIELHGDRNYYDDPSIVGGLATLRGKSMVVLGHQKGRGTKENIQH